MKPRRTSTASGESRIIRSCRSSDSRVRQRGASGRIPARQMPRVLANFGPRKDQRARGNAGASGAPAEEASCARIESTRVNHHRSTGTIRHSLRDGFNGFLRDLPGEPGFLATIPSAMRSIVTELTPASGRQDHTTSPSAGHAVRLSGEVRVHCISTHVRDDREPPLSSGETGRAGIADLPVGLSEIFFAAGLDRRANQQPSFPAAPPGARPESELLDPEANKLPFKRTVTFRGDTGEAFARAAPFVGETVRDAMEKRRGRCAPLISLADITFSPGA